MAEYTDRIAVLIDNESRRWHSPSAIPARYDMALYDDNIIIIIIITTSIVS